jgi:hypothetical protein
MVLAAHVDLASREAPAVALDEAIQALDTFRPPLAGSRGEP